MNKNKGIIGIGLILAIVLGIVVVGGGAYFLGKNKGENKEVNNPAGYLPNNQNQNTQVVDNSQSVKVASECMLPSITVLNPNEKETYTLWQTIDIKWASNCIDADKKISIGVNKVVTNQDQAVEDMHRIETTNSGSYKWLISKDMPIGQYEIYVTYTLENGYESVFGKSLNLITINSGTISTSQKCIDTATSLLPAYISKGQLSDLKLSRVEFFASNSDISGAQYFTGNPTKDACMVSVSYSVKPKPEFYSNFAAGNGHESSDGWIINKSGFATIDKNSNGYYVSSMGTGY
jgi:hypothetical protein